MAKLANRVKVNTATTGTGTLTLGAASSNAFCTFAEGGVATGQTVAYCIEEGNDFEIGTGVYTSSGTTLTRATVTLSKIAGASGTTKMTLAGAATVRIIARAEDLGGFLVAFNAYSASATITIPDGATKAKITLWGATGGGGGAKATASNTAIGGSGGGAGALIKFLSGLTPGNTLTLTIGAAGTAGATTPTDGGDGGNSTLASGTESISTLTANGGAGGKNANGAGKTSLGGVGGTASGGDLNITGMFGSSSTLGASTAGTAPDPTMFVNGPGGATGLGLSFGGRSGTSTSATGVVGLAGTVGGCFIEWFS